MVGTFNNAALAALSLCLAVSPLAGCVVDDDYGDETSQLLSGGVGPHLDPVIWVHGCPPPFANHEQISHFTDAQRSYFLSRGYSEDQLFRFVYSGPQCNSSIDFAAELADYVDEVLATTKSRGQRVDIISHSMGSVAARLYIAQGGDRHVRDFVSIAGVNHGTLVGAQAEVLQNIFGAPAYEGMKELYPPYACESETAPGTADVQAVLNGCLTATGREVDVDETPGKVSYLSIRNSYDEDVQPSESACLDQGFENDCSAPVNVEVSVPPGPGPCSPFGCPAHVTVLWDPGVMEMVYDHVAVGWPPGHN